MPSSRPVHFCAWSETKAALREPMLLVVQTKTASFSDTFASYPPWLQVAILTVVAAMVIWILGKLLKWAFWFLLVAVVAVGGMAVLWLLFH
jgi:hypothetical protein